MSHFAIAGLQLELSNQDNLYLIQNEISKTARRFPWVDMVVVSELATFGYNTATAQPHGGDADRVYCELACKHGIWILPGSYYEQRDGEVFNMAPVINPQGEIIARYRKIYPFMPYEQGCKSGSEFVVFEVPGVGRMGLCICYDQWFPELTRTLAWMGAEVIICPTLTNTIDRDVELAISRSTAAINQCYFININAGGQLAMGQSIIVGPEGNVIHQAGPGHEVIAFETDLDLVRRTRERGLHGLGQPLKSFRDSHIRFPPYDADADSPALKELGELTMPSRNQTG